eukprot:g33377.t1
MALQAALAAFRVGQHDVLTKFVANYEGKSLDLSSQNLGAVGASAVAKGLQVNKTLRELKIGGNSIGDTGAQALGEALQENKECKLEKLDISSNSIRAEGARHIAKALEVNQTLRELNLLFNKIGDDGANAIGEALKVNNTLQTLDLYKNNIGPDGAKAIGKVLEVNTTVQTLNIGYNNLGDKGAALIAEAIKVNKNLQTLWIASNNIGDKGAAAFADALKVNSSLKTLGLSFNGIGDEGVKHIAAALKVNQTLRELNLRFNKIGDGGANAIGEALKVNPILEKLSGVELKNHIQGLPQGVSDERILEYLRKQSKIKETTATKKNEEKTKPQVLSSAQQEARAMLQEPAVQERLKKLKEEKTRPRSYHAFLSHMQTQAAKDCMLLNKQLPLEHGLSVWYDNAETTRRLDTVGMMEAVAHSVCLLVIATRDYFSRKWCLFEVECAQELDVPIVVVLQTQGEYALSFESLLAAQPSWCNHEILRTPDQNKLWDSWVRVTLATRLEEEMEAAKKKGVPVPERKKAGSDGGASLNQAHLDALKAVDVDLDTLAVTSWEDLEEIFKELSVSALDKARIKAAKKILAQK